MRKTTFILRAEAYEIEIIREYEGSVVNFARDVKNVWADIDIILD